MSQWSSSSPNPDPAVAGPAAADIHRVDLDEIEPDDPQVDDVELDDVDGILVLDEVSAPTLPVWEPTGDPAVDAALEELSRLDDFERSEQIAVFESVHRRLHERLSDLAAGS